MQPSNLKPKINFQMIQDYHQKLKILRHNLIQSQMLNQRLKQELLKIGQQSNSLFISISLKSNRINELKSSNPQKQKKLNHRREQLKRIEYKTQKHEIKLKEYEDRLKRFQDMYKMKNDKNQMLLEKIHKLQNKLKDQKDKQIELINELNLSQPKIQPNSNPYLKVQSQYLKSINKKSNPIYDMQIQVLNTQTRMKKLIQQKQELHKKNTHLKSNINKLQQQILSIQRFLNSNSCIPQFIEPNIDSSREIEENKYQTQRSQNGKVKANIKIEEEERILKYSDKFSLLSQAQKYQSIGHAIQDRITKPSNQLPTHIISSISNFQNLKSKSMLNALVAKHSQITSQQQLYVDNLQQNSLLMNELAKINSILESQIVHENSKLSAFNIKNKKYNEMHKKTLF